jgi:fatty acid/phospholipid biosynthesis enzyme
VISHGSSSARAIANALRIAVEMVSTTWWGIAPPSSPGAA